MSGGFSERFIRRPVATTLMMLALLLVGLVAYPLLPVAPLPQIDFPTITVSAQLPGASPETMASSVAQPLERQFAQISGVSQMTSTSSLGATAITIQFVLDRNIDAAANDVQGAINAASGQLPKNMPSPPTYRKINPSDTPILILSVTSDVEPIVEVDDVGREHSRAAHQPDRRRVAGAHRRPAAEVDPHPNRPGQARREESAARGRSRADHERDGRQSQGLDHRRQAVVHDLRQRPADGGEGLERRHRRLSQRRAGQSSRHRQGDVEVRRTSRRPAGATASAASSSSCSSSPAPTSSRRSKASRSSSSS